MGPRKKPAHSRMTKKRKVNTRSNIKRVNIKRRKKSCGPKGC